MKIAWITDSHFDPKNASPKDALVTQSLAEALRLAAPDALLVTGDIAEAKTFVRWLRAVASVISGRPVYFVLGNPDCWGGWADDARLAARSLAASHAGFRYLSAEENPIELAPGVALIGHDGWADGLLGIYQSSVTKDAARIYDFSSKSESERRAFVASLGDCAARHLGASLARLPDGCRRVIVATHVPPFPGNQPMNDEWLPHLVCGAMGEVLVAAALARPDLAFEVYCGHTHRPDQFSPRPNLTVNVGPAAGSCDSPVRIIEV